MADFNSSLPVDITTSPVPISGSISDPETIGSYTTQGVTFSSGTGYIDVIQTTDPWIVLGSVNAVIDEVATIGSFTTQTVDGAIDINNPETIGSLTSQGVVFTSGTSYMDVIQSTDPWIVVGSVNAVIDDFVAVGSLAIQTVDGTVTVTDISTAGSIAIQTVDGTVTVTDIATAGSLAIQTVDGTVSTTVGARASGTTFQDYDTAAAVAAGGSDVHYYQSDGDFRLEKIFAGFSGKGKIIVGTGSPQDVPKFVAFNSTASPNIIIDIGENSIPVGTGDFVSVIRFNRETTEAQDVYSTIVGFNE